MRRLLLFLIARATPPADREWVLGDIVEEFEQVERSTGAIAARRWLGAEAWRVALPATNRRLRRRPPYPS